MVAKVATGGLEGQRGLASLALLSVIYQRRCMEDFETSRRRVHGVIFLFVF